MRKALFIFGELEDSDMEWLAGAARKNVVDAGAVLVRERTQISRVFILLKGRLSVRAGSSGAEINTLFPGEIVGELSFLDSRPASATVVAATESTVAEIPRSALAAKLERDPGFAARFYRALGFFLAHRLRRQTIMHRLPHDADGLSDEDSEQEDEIDPRLLEATALAGRRFEWIQTRLGVR
jgi:CRP-like cAMP-binding protein